MNNIINTNNTNTVNNVKAVIFDLDGTLLNTIKDITDSLNYALQKNMLPLVTINDCKKLVGNGAKNLIKNALKFVGCENYINSNLEEIVYQDYMFVYNLWKYNHTVPYESVVKTLHILKRKGLKLACLSNKPDRDTQDVVNRFFPGIFDVVLGGKEGLPLKPDPTSLIEVIRLLEVDKDNVVYCGDSDTDVKTGINAKVFTVGACYGFRGKKELVDSGANATINSMFELIKCIDCETQGVLLLDKPYGITSQDAVTKVKRLLKLSKIGHAGTLDPLATGLLVVLLGDSTKLSDYLLNDEKEYIGEVTIGVTTDTLDKEGQVTNTKKVLENAITEEMIDNLFEKLTTTLLMKVPMHSAVKVSGKKLYELARKGVNSIDVPEKEVTILKLKRTSNLEYKNDTLCVKFYTKVTKGTYIRSLCEEIGNRLGYPSYMTFLRRISCGNLTIDEANTIEDIEKGNYKILSPSDVIKDYPLVEVNDYLYNRVINGLAIRLIKDDDVIFITYKEKVIAVYEKTDDEKVNNKTSYKARRVWK